MRFVSIKDLNELQPGDKIRGNSSGLVYIVVSNFGNRVTAVRVADVTNPIEWEVLMDEESFEAI